MKTLFILLTTCFTGILSYSGLETVDNLDNCRGELSVEKNRNFKSADQDGASFILVLVNKSSNAVTYHLSTKNLSESCRNKVSAGNAASNSNVSLNVALKTNDTYMSESNTVIISSGQSLKFNVDVSVPNGTPFNSWSCIEVEAIPEQCSSESLKTMLSVYVPNPSEG